MGKINLGILVVIAFIFTQCKTTPPTAVEEHTDVLVQVVDTLDEKNDVVAGTPPIENNDVAERDSVVVDTVVGDSFNVNTPPNDNDGIGNNKRPVSPAVVYPKFPEKNQPPAPTPTLPSPPIPKPVPVVTEHPVISAAKMKELVKARATYEYEKTMYINAVHRVELVISKELSEDLIVNHAPTFQDSDKLTSEVIRIGDVVSAELIDPTDGQHFKITPLSITSQKVFTKDTFGYLWQWDVIPLKADLALPLRLKASTKIGDTDVNIPIFDTKITVISNEKEINSSLLWIGGIGLLVLLGLLVFFFFRKKKAEDEIAEKIPKKLADKWKMLIGSNKTDVVLEKLGAYLKKNDSKRLEDLLVLQSSFKENRRKANLNVISSEKEGIENARINLAILELLNEMEEDT